MAGWVVSWLAHRLTRGRAADLGELDRLAGELHEAETERDEAVSYLKAREAELIKDLTQTRHELQATMEALGHARAHAEELREWIQKVTEAS